jgi:type IV pilus modification protein PilV
MAHKRSLLPTRSYKNRRGFTLLEVLISMVVLTVGLIGLLGVFGMAMATTQTSQEDMIAKQIADEAMESIFTARDTSQAQWSDIQNINAGGIFVDPAVASPIYTAGNDGIVGTADDQTTGQPETMKMPGKDGIMGTADDVQISLSNYNRTIAITPVTDPLGNVIPDLRNVTITVSYTVPKLTVPKRYVVTGYISQYR